MPGDEGCGLELVTCREKVCLIHCPAPLPTHTSVELECGDGHRAFSGGVQESRVVTRVFTDNDLTTPRLRVLPGAEEERDGDSLLSIQRHLVGASFSPALKWR